MVLSRFLKEEWEATSKSIKFEVGNGQKVNIWTDLWYDESTLAEKHMNLSNIIDKKEAFVEDIYISLIRTV